MPSLIRQDDLLLRLVKDVTDIRSALRRVVSNIPLFDIANENTPTILQVSQNDYVPGNYDVLRLSSTQPVTITGFRGGVKGRSLRLFNVGAYEITLAHQSDLSLLGNRINSPTGFDIILDPDGELVLYYDYTHNQWITSYASNANRVSCTLRLSNFFTVTSGDVTYPAIPWDDVVSDTGDFYDPTNPTFITFPSSGFYECSAIVAWDTPATAWGSTIYSRVAIQDETGKDICADRRSFPGWLEITLTRTIYRSKGSKLYVRVFQNTGADLDILYLEDVGMVGTQFSITKL